MSDRPMTLSNLPPPDELAQVREQIKSLEERESVLRQLLITDPELRTGASYIAEIKTTKRMTVDIKELRACHPTIIEQFEFPLDVTRVVLSGISEDGEVIPARRFRNEAM